MPIFIQIEAHLILRTKLGLKKSEVNIIKFAFLETVLFNHSICQFSVNSNKFELRLKLSKGVRFVLVGPSYLLPILFILLFLIFYC